MRVIKNIEKKITVIILTFCFLSGAQKSEAHPHRPPGGKSWNIQITGKSFRDDNVGQLPRNPVNIPAKVSGNGPDVALEFNGIGRYKLDVSNALQFAVDYELNHTAYVDLSPYDLQSHTFGGNATYKIKPTWTLDLRYFYMYNILDNDSYNGIHYASPSMMFMIHPKIGYTRISYTFLNRDNFQNNLRDRASHWTEINQYIFFSNFKRRITLGYVFKNDAAKGSIYDLESHLLTFELKTPLFWGINFKARYGYGDVNYDTRLIRIGGAGIRNDDKHIYLVELSKVLLKNVGFLNTLIGSLRYENLAANSTDKLFEHDKNVVTFSIKGRF